MAKLRISPTLISQALFHDADKCPVICGASWDDKMQCVVFDIIGDGVPETDDYVRANFIKRIPIIVTFEES